MTGQLGKRTAVGEVRWVCQKEDEVVVEILRLLGVLYALDDCDLFVLE